MSKTTAPLLSFEARGQIAKSMVYSSWRGVKYARRHVIPANPRSTEQQTTRNTFATLREMWKLLPAVGKGPWDAFAQGRPFTGVNGFIGENMLSVRGDANFNDFIGSPGAKGGVAPDSVVGATGTGASGSCESTITATAVIPGWTLLRAEGIAFPDQDPADRFDGVFASASTNAPSPMVLNFTGLGSAVNVQISAWIVWQKPDGTTAYSVGTTVQAVTVA